MARIVKLTENDIQRLVKKVIKEAPIAPVKAVAAGAQNAAASQRVTQLAQILKTAKPKSIMVIQSPDPKLNGKPVSTWMKENKITRQEYDQAKQMSSDPKYGKVAQGIQQGMTNMKNAVSNVGKALAAPVSGMVGAAQKIAGR